MIPRVLAMRCTSLVGVPRVSRDDPSVLPEPGEHYRILELEGRERRLELMMLSLENKRSVALPRVDTGKYAGCAETTLIRYEPASACTPLLERRI
jgi:hypothetical protein